MATTGIREMNDSMDMTWATDDRGRLIETEQGLPITPVRKPLNSALIEDVAMIATTIAIAIVLLVAYL